MRTEDVLIVLFCEIDDWVGVHPLPQRPGQVPACADSEVLTFALARELLGYDSERRFWRVLRADWGHLFPHIPAQSELNRRTRWLQGALELLRRHWFDQMPERTSSLLGVDTTPVPVVHRTRVRPRHRGDWYGPGDVAAGFGYCAAKKAWFFGFRVAILAPVCVTDPVPHAWALCPAAVNERDVALTLLHHQRDAIVVTDRGMDGADMRDRLLAQDNLLLTPARRLRRYHPTTLIRAFVRRRRNRIERPFQNLKDRFRLEQHRAKTVWGLVTRITTKLAALTLRARWRHLGLPID